MSSRAVPSLSNWEVFFCSPVATSLFSGELLSIVLVGDLLLPKISLHLGTTVVFLSSSRFACKVFHHVSDNLCCIFDSFAFVLTCDMCCIMMQSMSLRLSLRFGTKTVHCGSLVAAYCLFWCVAGNCAHVMTAPASSLIQISAQLFTTSCLGHEPSYFGCARYTVVQSTSLHSPHIDISAFTFSLLMKFLMLSIIPYGPSTPLPLLCSSSQR